MINFSRLRIRAYWEQNEGESLALELKGWEPSHLYEPSKEDKKDVRAIIKYINDALKNASDYERKFPAMDPITGCYPASGAWKSNK